MTRTGKALTWLTEKTSFSMTMPLWRTASARFASGAGDEAHVFVWPGGPAIMSVYSTIETPILQRNEVSIVTHWAWESL
jgi:hypothetical protein